MMILSKPLMQKLVLVVDDSPAMCELMAEAYATWGATAVTATTGAEAMLLVELREFDLAVVDLFMPAPDGWHVLEQINRVQPALMRRSLVMTGHLYDRAIEARLAMMRLPHLFKPFDMSELERASRLLLRRAVRAIA